MDNDVPEPVARAKPDRTLLAVLIVVALLVVLALVAVLVRGTARESLDPNTPEGVVQRYAQAVIDGDDATASQYLAGRLDGCDYYERGTGKLRLTFRSSTISGDSATVLVTVTTSYGGDLFGNGEYSYDEQFRLVSSGESWLISEAPYDFLTCSGAENK